MGKAPEQQTVGEIVAADWRAAAIFEEYGIDFCCGGRRTLADACRLSGTDAAALQRALAQLASSAPVEDASAWSIDQLLDHIIETHHTYVRAALPRILRYLSKLTHVHGTRHPELARIFEEFEVLGRDLLQHLRKEEGVLFPYIRELGEHGLPGPSPFGTVENPIRMMEREHEGAGRQLNEIRRLSGNYTAPPDGCATYRICFEELRRFEHDLHRHVHLEDNILFPRAVALESSHGRSSRPSAVEPPNIT